MFQYDIIQTGLSGKVGFRQNVDPDGLQLTALTTADHFVNDHHAMLTFENLKSLTDFDPITGITDKDQAFTDWLTERMNGSLKKMVNQWRSLKMKGASARTLIERQRLFRPEIGDGSLSDNDGRFAGLEIVSTDSMAIAHKVERIGLQLDTNQTVRVYLFRDGDREPISFKDVAYTKDGGVQWEKVDWLLVDGGKYFIGYDENRLSGQAVDGTDFNDHMASGAMWTVGKHYSISAFKSDTVAYTGGIGVMEVESSFIVADPSDPSTGATWDVGQLTYSFSDNYGINLELTSFCDYSSLIVGQCESFAYAWCLRVAMDLMKELIFNPNSIINRNNSNAAEQQKLLLYEVNGDPSEKKGEKTGLKADYEAALDGIMFDGASIDKVCLPCKKKGIRHKAHG